MLLADGWLHRNIDTIGLVGLIVTVVALVATIVIYNRQKQRKTLDYAVVSSVDLVAAASSGVRLGVVWMPAPSPTPLAAPRLSKDELVRSLNNGEGRVLSQPRQTNILVKNTGRLPITAEDFTQRISLHVARGVIVDAQVTKVSHNGIIPLGEPLGSGESSSGVDFAPVLLNRGDWFEIRVTTDQTHEDPKLSCWLRGQDRDMRLDPRLASPALRVAFERAIKRTRSADLQFVLAGLSTVIAAGGTVVVTVLSGKGH